MSNIQGSPALVTINGKDYQMSPLSDKAIGEVNNYIRKRILKAARQSLEGENDKTLIDATMTAAMREVMKVDWLKDPEGTLSSDSLFYLFWIMLRPLNQGLTLETLSTEVLKDPDCITDMMDTFSMLQTGNLKTARKPKAAKLTKKKKR